MKRKNSKRGERDQVVLEALEKKGSPATVKEIEKSLPLFFRQHISSVQTTNYSCRKLFKLGKLVKWGGQKNKTIAVYGLPHHEKPDVIPTPIERQRRWTRGIYKLDF